jgi:hypothetical protein
MNAEMFGILCDIGEISSIMRDIAAREISENKPIAGTAINLLARLISDQVERGMLFTPDRAIGEVAPTPDVAKAAPQDRTAAAETSGAAQISGHDYTARADSAWPGGLDLRGLHGALSGVVTCLCALQDMAAGADLDGDAFEPLLATLTPWRDRTRAARDILETESAARHSEAA